MNVAYNIQVIRRKWRESQEAFGARFGVGRSAVAKWESGDNDVSSSVLIALEDITGISISRILRDELTLEEIPEIGQPPISMKATEKPTENPDTGTDPSAALLQALATLTAEVSELRKKMQLMEKRLDDVDGEVLRQAGKSKRG